MHAVPETEIAFRIRRFQESLNELKLDGAIIVQRIDLYYLSGTGQDAHLFVPAEGDPLLLVRKNLDRAKTDSPINRISPLKNFTELKSVITDHLGRAPDRLGLELDVLPVNQFRVYEKLFNNAEFGDISGAIREVRMIKSAFELELMRKAAELNDRMFALVPDLIKEGMSEIELAGRIELFFRANGHQGLVRVRGFNGEVFYGHVMAGPNLAVPSCSVGPTGGPGCNASFPQGVGLRNIGRNEPIQIDYVAVIDGYMVDQARTYYIGEAPPRFQETHELALRIQNEIVQTARPGISCESLYDKAVEIAGKAGKLDGFLGWPQSVPFVGHGIGLELDELPVLGKRSPHFLKPGMVIAIEPKFIFPGEGLAGIENSFVVTETGMEKLTLYDDGITNI
jgi:Xaa-Pro aminopeptidase